jgi:hypothetical protein
LTDAKTKGNKPIQIRAPKSVHQRLELAAKYLSRELRLDLKGASVGLMAIREFLDRLEADGKIPHLDEDEETTD